MGSTTSSDEGGMKAESYSRKFVLDFCKLPEAQFLMVVSASSQTTWLDALVTHNFTYRDQQFHINDKVRVEMSTMDFVVEGSSRDNQPLAQLEIAEYLDRSADYTFDLNVAYESWSEQDSVMARKRLAHYIGILVISRYVVENPSPQLVGAKMIQITKISVASNARIDFTYKIDDQPETIGTFYVRFGFDVSMYQTPTRVG